MSADPTEGDDSVVHVTLVEGEEEIDGSAESLASAARHRQLATVNENPDDRRNRWLAALEDIQSLNGPLRSEASQNPSGTVEQDGSSVADDENTSDDSVPLRGEGRHPRMTRRVGGETPIHQPRRSSSSVSGPDRTDPPANGLSG